jgi:hypothetical protein
MIQKEGVDSFMGFIVTVMIDVDSPEALEKMAIQEVEKTDVVANAVFRGEYGTLSKIDILGIAKMNEGAPESMVFNWYPMT